MTKQQDNYWGDVFTNETQAAEAFKTLRLKKGVICKKCNGTKHYWLAHKLQFQCSVCRFRTTLRSGTMLEGSKLPISYFFIAWSLIIKNNNHVTLDEFQLETKHKYYEPLWEYLHKIKTHFRHEDSQKIAEDFIEVTNNFFLNNPLDN